jgi:ATP-dependent DNA helicase RecG
VVQSPGGLPSPINLENLLKARFSRNVVIVQVLADLGFIERLGYGLDRVVYVMQQNKMRPPQFEESAGTFIVTLYKGELNIIKPVKQNFDIENDEEINQRQLLALNYLRTHRRITSSTFQEFCPNVHAETLRRDLADLVKRGILIKIGDKRATYYILKKN